MQMTDGLMIHRALSRLKAVQRALAIKMAEEQQKAQELADAYVRIQELEANNLVEVCKAKTNAENLQEEIERLKNQIASEVHARKSAESARRAYDSFANSQRRVNRRERELDSAEGDCSSLQYRLEEARRCNEMDLLELDLMAERLVAEESLPQSRDGAMPIEIAAKHSTTIGEVTIRRREVEGTRVVGRVKLPSMSPAMFLEDGPVPGAHAQLEGHKSAMTAARVSVALVRHKTQRLQARIRVFKMRERNRVTMAVLP